MKKQELLRRYKNGERTFYDLDLENEDYRSLNLEGVRFEGCFLSVDFRNANLNKAVFINGNIKYSDFGGANLSNAHFENLGIEGSNFKDAKIDGMVFINNHAYSQSNIGQKEFEDWVKNME